LKNVRNLECYEYIDTATTLL